MIVNDGMECRERTCHTVFSKTQNGNLVIFTFSHCVVTSLHLPSLFIMDSAPTLAERLNYFRTCNSLQVLDISNKKIYRKSCQPPILMDWTTSPIESSACMPVSYLGLSAQGKKYRGRCSYRPCLPAGRNLILWSQLALGVGRHYWWPSPSFLTILQWITRLSPFRLSRDCRQPKRMTLTLAME